MIDFMLGLLDVSVILFLFLWGDVLVRLVLNIVGLRAEILRFASFIVLIVILSLFNNEIAGFILKTFGKQVAWLFFGLVLLGAWVDYRRKY